MSDSKDRDGWTCYHCGEHFITHTHAKLHFGIEHTGALPACLIKGSEGGLVKYIRELEERLIPYQNEDTELMRDISRQRGEKLNAIASAEEVGYARGLKEYTKLEEEIERLKNELTAARQQGFEEGFGEAVSQQLATSYIQTVPDKCDRIVWRNNYYHLPMGTSYEAGKQAGRDEVLKGQLIGAGQGVNVGEKGEVCTDERACANCYSGQGKCLVRGGTDHE